jgi:hypothetical protein
MLYIIADKLHDSYIPVGSIKEIKKATLSDCPFFGI